MLQESMVGHHSQSDAEHRLLRLPHYSPSRQESRRSAEDRPRGLMVFDHKGRLVKADRCAERILATVGVELTRNPRLRIDALDTTDSAHDRDCELPGWLDREWIEPVIEGNERLGTVVQIPDVNQRRTTVRGGLPSYKLRRAVEFIEAHFDRSVTFAHLAAVVNMSPFHFHRQFKRSTGLTPRDYIHQLRIERAKTLLCQSDLPLADLAVKVGFADQSHFSATFRRATSMTPLTYRKTATLA
jgi:AraC-like DNA-binding protein